MPNDRDEQNRDELPGVPNPQSGEFGGDYARDTHREGLGDDYARDAGWSGGGAHDQYARDERPAGDRDPENEKAPE